MKKGFVKIRALVAFTLIEVLITLVIIGVVAGMTLPTLIAKINDTVNANSAKIFNAKLIKGLNLTKTSGDLNNTYSSTYDFLVNGLSKNLKMTKICDSEHIRDCIPYNKIKYEGESGNEKTIDVKDLKTAAMLKLKEPYTDPAAFVLADGTPAIVSYNKECVVDTDKADTTINGCLAGLYDINGSRKPNKFGTKVQDGKTAYTGDLRAFNGASIFGVGCFSVLGNICILSAAKVANDSLVTEIQTVDPSYTQPKYTKSSDNSELPDYWQLANDYCTKIVGGNLPSRVDLANIANILYGVNNVDPVLSWNENKDAVLSSLGITMTGPNLYIWSAGKAEDAFYRHFNSGGGSGYGNYYNRRNYDTFYAVCIEN